MGIAEELIEKIDKEKVNSRNGDIFMAIFIILFCLLLCGIIPRSRLFVYIGFEVLFYCYYVYVTNIQKNMTVNRTVIQIESSNDDLTFMTPEVKLLYIISRRSVFFKINKNELNLVATEFPLKKTFRYDGKVFSVNSNSVQYYILVDYFESGLENLSKITPLV